MSHKTVPELLRDGAATYEERNKTYGDNYKRIGPIMAIIFPDGIPCRTPADHNRFGVWYMAFNKLIRYAQSFPAGHVDSAHDAIVYAAMLEELTLEAETDHKICACPPLSIERVGRCVGCPEAGASPPMPSMFKFFCTMHGAECVTPRECRGQE